MSTPDLDAATCLLWLDLETTGLEVRRGDKILEIGCFFTDEKFWPSGAFQHLVLHFPTQNHAFLDAWCQAQHGKSGLLTACAEAALSVAQADEILDNWVVARVKNPQKIVLAGSTIRFDYEFVREYLPKFAARLSHRTVDVSSLLEISRRRHPGRAFEPGGPKLHRALADATASHEALKPYLEAWPVLDPFAGIFKDS